MKNRISLIFLALFILLTILPLFGTDGILLASGEDASAQLGTVLPLWSAIPFIGILFSIAILQ